MNSRNHAEKSAFAARALRTGLAMSAVLAAAACQFGSPRQAAPAAAAAVPGLPRIAFDTLQGRIRVGESLGSITRGMALPPADIQTLQAAIKENFRFKLYAGQPYRVIRRVGPEGPSLEAFILEDRYADRRHELRRPSSPALAAASAPAVAPGAVPAPEPVPAADAQAGKLAYGVSAIPVRTDTVAVNGTLSNNLYDAFVSRGETGALIQQVTKIFAWDLDFFKDPRTGDAFSLLVEKKYGEDGSFRGYGRVLSAKYVNRGHAYYGILYGDAYYDQDGHSLEKMLMKAPLNYVRVSSAFSSARLHPVLGVTRPHWGIDYAGPLNTKILAAGDGVVEYCKWVNGYGKTLKIRHNGVYNTYYAHLNGFAKGMGPGRRVRQGEVIAYMGRTGLATGVHLDYRVEYQGRYINPATLKMEARAGVGQAEWQAFCAHRDVMLARMSNSELKNFAAAPSHRPGADPAAKAL